MHPEPNPADFDRPEPSIADHNVERLLGTAYRPEVPDPAFVERVLERVVREATMARQADTRAPRLRLIPARLLVLAAAAAILLGLGLLLFPRADERHTDTQVAAPAAPKRPTRDGFLLPGGILTAAAASTTHTLPMLTVGQSMQTAARQRLQLALPDGSRLFMNASTQLALVSERHVKLRAGEVFVEVASHGRGSKHTPFVVEAPDRRITAMGTRFDVRTEPAGTHVTVAQGSVQVSGLEQRVVAGQQFQPGAARLTAAPRISRVCDWMRDLLAAGTPLVPASRFRGGALVAVAPDGKTTSLSLRRSHVDVHIEDGFARTTIDQTYFNNADWRLEGTFYFPLPRDASLSRLAMYVDGRLMEGGMAERAFARDIFESIVRRQQDPALLEWVDGTTFKMRVFPLEPHQEKRLILGYTQHLPSLYGRLSYRFPGGHSLGHVDDWSVHVRVKAGAGLSWNSPTHLFQATSEGGDLLLDTQGHDIRRSRDVVLEVNEPAPTDQDETRFSSFVQDGWRYLMLRYQPMLSDRVLIGHRRPRDWIILFESSADRTPLLARAQIEVLRNLLASAEHQDTFAVLTAGTSTHAFAAQPLPVSPENVQAALDWLARTHLIGALDLCKALTTLDPIIQSAHNPYLVHLGSGMAGMGQRQASVLARRVPRQARYVGVAIGNRWSPGFMEAAAARTGGYVTRINPDEPIAWRVFDLAAVLNTPRLHNMRVTDPAGRVPFLCTSEALAQGEQLCAVARLPAKAVIPDVVIVTGDGTDRSFRQRLAVEHVAANAAYLPRTWARLEIDRLLTQDPKKSHDEIVALSKAMYVMTPFTSLLVLENEEMYEQYKVDRGRKDHWAMYPCPERIPVANPAAAPQTVSRKPTTAEILKTILVRVPPPVVIPDPAREAKPALTALDALAAFTGPYRADDDTVDPPLLGTGSDMRVADALQLPNPSPRLINGMRQARWGGLLGAGGLGGVGGLGGLGGAGFGGGLGIGGLGVGGIGGNPPGGADFVTPGTPGMQAFQGLMTSGGGQDATPDDDVDIPRIPEPPAWLRDAAAASPVRVRRVREQLARAVTIHFPASATVAEALQTLRERYGLSIMLDSQAFKDDPDLQDQFPEGIEQQRVGGVFDKVPLGTVLRSLIKPVGGVYVISDGYVLITTAPQVRAAQRYAPYLLTDSTGAMSRGSRFAFAHSFLVFDDGRFQHQADLTLGWKPLSEPKTRSVPLALPISLPLQPVPRPSDSVVPEDWWSVATTTTLEIPLALDDPLGNRHNDTALLLGFDDPDLFRLAQANDAGMAPSALLYNGTPRWSGDLRVCRDLLSLAPGLNSNRADILAVLEAKAEPPMQDRPGTVDAQARRLIERARAGGWQTVRVQTGHGQHFDVTVDGKGRFAYRRKLSGGLHEQAVCDGTTLWQIYPELGLAARRPYSRFHRAVFNRLVPWILPPVDELARGTDVCCRDGRAVRLIPHAADAPEVELIFNEMGRLVERRMVERAGHAVLSREQYGGAGTARLLDKNGHQMRAIALRSRPAAAPDLHVNVRDLVVLPMPMRTTQVIKFQDHVILGGEVENRDDLRLGLYVLLAAAGDTPSIPWPRNVRSVHPYTPVTEYLAFVSSDAGSARAFDQRAWPPCLRLRSMLYQSLSQKSPLPATLVQEQLRLLESGVPDAVGWAVLRNLQARASDAAPRHAIMAGCLRFADVPGLGYPAHYEHARGLLQEGRRQKAAAEFLALYDATLRRGHLPRIDPDFVRATLNVAGRDRWTPLMHQTAARLVKAYHREAAVVLAWQCWQLDQPQLSTELLNTALAGQPSNEERWQATLTAALFLWQTDQLRQAHALLEPLESEPAFADRPVLWRLSALLSLRLRRPERFLACLEKVVDLEFKHLPDTINLEAARNDLGLLLTQYLHLVEETSGKPLPADLSTRVVRAADRWRFLDPADPTPCPLAAAILYKLGQKELAWDYLNTPIALFPADANAWVSLAAMLSRQNDYDLADRAYEQAIEADPDNAGILWNRAQNLERAGHQADARRLYTTLARGSWEPCFAWMQEAAQQKLRARARHGS